MAQNTDGDQMSLGQSGAQRFFSRALYVFFAKPILFLIPVVLVTAFGVYSAVSAPDEYRSSGSLNVSADTFLSELSQVRSSEFSYETPASVVATKFNEFLQTDGFAQEVAAGAGLDDEISSGAMELGDLRADLFASASGDSLMRVFAVGDTPDQAKALAESAISTYRNYVLASEVDEYDSAQAVFDDQVSVYESEVDAAFDAYSDYLVAHPPPDDARDARDIAEQTEIARLNDQLTRAQERLDTSIDAREAARQASISSAADIDQRLKVIDAPSLPTSPESGLRAMLMTVILFGMLGLFISIAAVCAVSLLDRSIHSAADLDVLGAPVRAVVPRERSIRVDPSRMNPVGKVASTPMRKAG